MDEYDALMNLSYSKREKGIPHIPRQNAEIRKKME